MGGQKVYVESWTLSDWVYDWKYTCRIRHVTNRRRVLTWQDRIGCSLTENSALGLQRMCSVEALSWALRIPLWGHTVKTEARSGRVGAICWIKNLMERKEDKHYSWEHSEKVRCKRYLTLTWKRCHIFLGFLSWRSVCSLQRPWGFRSLDNPLQQKQERRHYHTAQAPRRLRLWVKWAVSHGVHCSVVLHFVFVQGKTVVSDFTWWDF